MEGIYQSNLYSSQQLPYILPPTHPEPNSYSHYGTQQQQQQQQQYRSSAFSNARSSPTSSSTPYHHSAGLDNAPTSSTPNYTSHGDLTHHHDTHPTHSNENYHHHHQHWNSSPNLSWNSSPPPPPPLPPPSRNNSFTSYNSSLPHMSTPIQRPKLTTTVWEDEGTLCYQVDAKSVCVARRQDNDMINGTKLLNVVGMSRGKRDGILKNEKGRVVVKVGAMHLKGVWITFPRARDLATKFKIVDILYPLFVEDPSVFLSVPPPPPPPSSTAAAAAGTGGNTGLPIMLPSSIHAPRGYYNRSVDNYNSFHMQPYQSLPSITSQDQLLMRSQQQQQQQQQTNGLQQSGSCSPVPGAIATATATAATPTAAILSNEESEMYLLNNPYEYRNRFHSSSAASGHHASSSTPSTQPTSSSYHLYSNENEAFSSSPYETHSSPYLRKSIVVVEPKEEEKRSSSSSSSIDFPTSPPPESSGASGTTLKYNVSSSSPYTTTTTWSESDHNRKSPLGASSSPLRTSGGLVMVPGRHPLSSEIEDKSKGRKRPQEKSVMPSMQRKRVKQETCPSP